MAPRDRAHNGKAQPVVVGVADHGGWAILVTAAAVNGRPVVLDRRRVPLIDKGVPSQPYHHDTLTLADDEAEALLRTVKRSIATCTAQAFDRLPGDLGPAHLVTAITIREPPLPRLPATVKDAHASYHVQCRADGMLYHSALCDTAARRDWNVVRCPRGEELVRAAEALRCRERDLEQFIGDLKSTLRPPWAAEHRSAFAAAIAELSQRTTLHLG